MHTVASVPDNPAVRQRFFRALQQADPKTRQMLILLAKGYSVERVGRAVDCHPRFVTRRMEAFARSLA
jgi:hypothetical protein